MAELERRAAGGDLGEEVDDRFDDRGLGELGCGFVVALGDALVEVVRRHHGQASRALVRRLSPGSRLRLSSVMAVWPVRKIDQIRTAATTVAPTITAM
jgi:hypothetical protein